MSECVPQYEEIVGGCTTVLWNPFMYKYSVSGTSIGFYKYSVSGTSIGFYHHLLAWRATPSICTCTCTLVQNDDCPRRTVPGRKRLSTGRQVPVLVVVPLVDERAAAVQVLFVVLAAYAHNLRYGTGQVAATSTYR